MHPRPEALRYPEATRTLLIVTALLAVPACSSPRQTLGAALQHQPAGLVTAFDDGFLVGQLTGECIADRHSRLVLIDPNTGAVRWERAVPWSTTEPLMVGDVAVSASATFDENPPSVLAADGTTGKPRWQRFVASESIGVQLRPDDLIDLRTTDRSMALDPSTGGVVHDLAIGDAAPSSPSPKPPGDRGPLVTINGPTAFEAHDGVVSATSTADGSTRWTSAPLPVDATFSTAISVGADDGAVLVLIGSGVGPAHRLVVLDATTGSLRWQDDGARNGTIAGGVLLLDRRVGGSPDRPERQVVARDLVSGTQLWVRAGTLTALLGHSSSALTFAVGEPGAGLDRLVRLDPRTGQASDGFTSAVYGGVATDSASPVLTDELVLAPDGNDLAAFDATTGTRRWSRTFDLPVRSAQVGPDGILVATGDPSVGCG